MTEAMPFLQKYDITFLRPPTIKRAPSLGWGSCKKQMALGSLNSLLAVYTIAYFFVTCVTFVTNFYAASINL